MQSMFRNIRTQLVVITSCLSAESELDKKGEVLLKNGVRQVMQLIEGKEGEAERGEIFLSLYVMNNC